MTVLIRGSNLAALVCAVDLVKNGFRTKLLTDHKSKIGGHFAGLRIEDMTIDFGMVLLEPRFSNRQRSISEYSGQSGNLVNEFNRSVFDWLESIQIKLDKVKVKSFYNGFSYDDFMIADSLSVIDALNISQDEIDILKACSEKRSEQVHPRQKNAPPLDQMSLKEALTEFYGNSLADFLFQIVNKIAGPDALELPVKFHRLFWLPLYYPETILSFIETGKTNLEMLEFWSPRDGGVSGMIQLLVEFLQKNELFEFDYTQPELTKDIDYPELDERNIEISFSELNNPLIDIAKNKRISLGFVIYEFTDSIEKIVTHNLDPKTKWFRTSQSLSSVSSVAVELGYVEDHESETELIERGETALKQLSINAISEPLVFRTNFSFPTELVRAIAELEKISTESNTYGTDIETKSFNNQVLLGLRAALDVKERGMLHE
jgi:hypothetical protein